MVKRIISGLSITLTIPGNPDVNPPVAVVAEIQTTGATFLTSNVKLYVPVVTFSINDTIKFLENIEQGFKRTIFWNKYRPEITTHTKNHNLDYLVDPTFRNINRLFVFSFRNGNGDPTRHSFYKYYMSLVEIIYFNTLINSIPFFDQPVKNKKAYEKLIEMSRNDDYTTGNLLDYLYHQKYYKLIGMSRDNKSAS